MAFPLSTMLTALSQRLYDPTYQFWSQAELTLYVQESMREFNAYTGYWRGDFTFPAQSGVTWYDITNLGTAPTTLRPENLTTADLFTIIEYHLLEPPVGMAAWTGSSQFSLTDIQNAILQRLQELLGATGCFVQRITVPGTPGRIALDVGVLDLRRVAFLPSAGNGSPSTLWEDDSWAWQAFEPDYTTKPQGIPQTYAMSTQPLLSFDVDRVLNVPGTYELLITQATGSPPAPPTIAVGSQMYVPDDWSWLTKWGALADLLGRESNAKDELRARYCEQRYAQGTSLLAQAPALLGFRVNNIPTEIDAVTSADQYSPAWEGQAPGAPSIALTAGLNLIALAPAPNSTAYSFTATVVANAPVPSLPTDPINVTQDVYEALLDNAQHIATFKQGGAELVATIPMHQRFLQTAALYASRIAEMGEFATALYAQSEQESERNPRFTSDTPAEVTGGD